MPQTSFAAPLVGREAELARLTGVLAPAPAGGARAVLIAGDAGVGKTRLLDEAAARAAGAGRTVLTGHCVDLGDVGLPYLPFTEILGALAADQRFVLAAHPVADRLLGAGRTPPGTPTGGCGCSRASPGCSPSWPGPPRCCWSWRTCTGPTSPPGTCCASCSAGACSSAPGTASRCSPPTAPTTCTAATRCGRCWPSWSGCPAWSGWSCGRCRCADVARLVRTLPDRPLPEATVRRIVERAEGNAFYAEELVAATGPGDDGVPSALADVLLIRFEQLTDTAQQVLRTAAVAGPRVGHDLLRDAVGLPEEELEAALREAVGRQLLVAGDGDTYAFRHALAREAVYADLLPGERARLHGAFARLLTARDHRPESAAERAHHHRASHDLAAALAASLEAADHAERVGAPAEELRAPGDGPGPVVGGGAGPAAEGHRTRAAHPARLRRRGARRATATARSPAPGPRCGGLEPANRLDLEPLPPGCGTPSPGTCWTSTA
ncbi:LuxR family transcriptional regulator OS=Streptomyces fumanus OX=67302 GN=GCM10018772_54790 PE=4 SV=1 [Streptomyces fumanus]